MKQKARISSPKKNRIMFREVFLYMLGKAGAKPNIGEAAMYKLLYFVDFDFYEKYEEQMIGMEYVASKSGPTPVDFTNFVEGMITNQEVLLLNDLSDFHVEYDGCVMIKYLPLRKPDLSLMSQCGIKLIDAVLDLLSDKDSKEIGEYSRGDVPYLATEPGGIIDFESVFYRAAPYSVREYDVDEADI